MSSKTRDSAEIPRGLYVHIPFCLKKCHYCDFVITTKRSPSDRKYFFESMHAETKANFKKYGRLKFGTFYLGGGTPSALSSEEMARLVDLIQDNFDFDPGFEFTCEVNPSDVDAKKLESYKKLGINRISLGVQAFQEHLLEDMGRPHKVSDIFETHNILKETGFENISFDLINGLPNQTLEEFLESLEKLVEMKASQLSLYDLDVHEKTVYGLRRRENRLPVPNEAMRAEMYEAAQSVMTANCYHHYEISTFAISGFESRHNLLYWHNQEYMGLGPGAFSYLNGVRYQFSGDVRGYLEKCRAENWTPDTQDVLTAEEKEKETLFTGLRLLKGVDLNSFSGILEKLQEKLAAAQPYGLFDVRENRLYLTAKGRALAERSFRLLLEKN